VYIITLSSPVRVRHFWLSPRQGTVELLEAPPPPHLLLKGTNHSLSICVGWRAGKSATKGISVNTVHRHC